MNKSIIQIQMAARAILLASLAGIFALLAARAQAQVQVTLYQDTGNYSYGEGGEFNAMPSNDLLALNPTLVGYQSGITAGLTSHGSANFQTFCLETSEFFTPGNTYDVSVSDKIMYNGGQFLPNGEPLTLGTAWLYSQFAAGTLGGYDYIQGAGRIATAGNLQQAIWYLQGEAGSLVNGGADGTSFYNTAQTALAALSENINDPANGAYGVVALNLTDGSNHDQDQLMLVPVPEPSVLALAGLSGLFLVLFRRQRK